MTLMARIDPEKKRTMGMLLSKSFAVGNPPLSAVEQSALDCVIRIAESGVVATQGQVCASIGSLNGVTATSVINRLVAKGYVERIGGPLQKALWLKIVATGQTTAEPHDKTPHWRYRTEPVQSPAIQRVRERSKTLADMIEAKAKSLGKPLAEFLMDCVYVGFHEINQEEHNA